MDDSLLWKEDKETWHLYAARTAACFFPENAIVTWSGKTRREFGLVHDIHLEGKIRVLCGEFSYEDDAVTRLRRYDVALQGFQPTVVSDGNGSAGYQALLFTPCGYLGINWESSGRSSPVSWWSGNGGFELELPNRTECDQYVIERMPQER